MPIPGYEGVYSVSDHGRVRSAARSRTRGGVLRPGVDASGYESVQLCAAPKRGNHRIHRLVLLAFVGECPPGMECDHIDGDRLNNALSNLRWVSRAENSANRLRVGNDLRGERNGSCKLSDAQVTEIRERAEMGGESRETLAARFSVHVTTIGKILRGDSWTVQPYE